MGVHFEARSTTLGSKADKSASDWQVHEGESKLDLQKGQPMLKACDYKGKGVLISPQACSLVGITAAQRNDEVQNGDLLQMEKRVDMKSLSAALSCPSRMLAAAFVLASCGIRAALAADRF